jgi:CO/xanthine dehydrogenase FAD-binding subunit
VRSYLPSYELRRPLSLEDALRTLSAEPGVFRPFAGGTDLMVLLEAGALRHERFLSLWGIRELRGIRSADNELSIGALTTYTDLLNDPTVRAEFPLLCDAASQTGGVATQNRGTIGGNIANGSPAADTPPALLVHDAEIELVSSRGSRRLPYHRFHTGYKTSELAPDELIAAVHLPRAAAPETATGRRSAHYRKVGTRKAQAIAKVCFAATATMRGDEVQDVRLAFGSVAPTVVRATAAEDAVRGRVPTARTIAAALDALESDVAPIDDIRSTARYRAFVCRQLTAAFLQSLGGGSAAAG